jgi:tetratricopeptide (TPR) repeat protein
VVAGPLARRGNEGPFEPPETLPPPHGDVDLDADLPAVLGVGLPAPLSSPSPANAARSRAAQAPISLVPDEMEEPELPMPRAELPSSALAGLPMTAASLPATAAGLPSPIPALPVARGLSPLSPLPPARAPSSPPTAGFGSIDLPLLSPEPPVLSTPFESSDVGPGGARLVSDVPPLLATPRPPPVTSTAELALEDAAPRRAPSGSPDRIKAAGPAFGEINFGAEPDGSLGPAPELASVPAKRLSEPPPGDDDMEFGAIPQEIEPPISTAPTFAAPMRPSPTPPTRAAPAARAKVQKRAAVIWGTAVALVVVAGGALEVTSLGAFGRHSLFDLLNAEKFAQEQTTTIERARSMLASDTFSDANQAIAALDAEHARMPRVAGVLAYGAFVGYITELRYGREPGLEAHAKQQLSELPVDRHVDYADLARAAEAAVGWQLPRAKQMVESIAPRGNQDLDTALLAGEVELLVKEADKALESFSRAAMIDGNSARSMFGKARAQAVRGERDAAVALAQRVLERSPSHVGARLLVARATWNASRDEKAAMAMLNDVIAAGPVRAAASPVELVEAFTQVAQIHMARSRMTQAETALNEALKIDPKAGAPLSAMGELLYGEGRYTDALARFETGIQADPDGVTAKIGAAKTKIALERLQEAKEQLKKLRDARPRDFDATYWLGRAEQALGDRPAAESSFTEGIRLGGQKPETALAYVALAELLTSEGHAVEAQAKLDEAKKSLPATASTYRALGDVDLSSGRYDSAKEMFESALELAPDDLTARYKLGVTLRRMNRFADAESEFEKVAAEDRDFPGLALERGLLYEASNRTREALEYYQQALARAPDDPDMMLRVGSAEVASGQASQAEEILRKVIAKRPNSAEVNHYLGRALMLKGNLAEALRDLKRAVELDPNRAEYHLYLGWAANDAGQPLVAQEELTRALELDKGLADAYWQLGVMMRKQGAVVDAIKNLQRALELRPSRFEAYATLAECFEDENRAGDAALAWQKAIRADGSRAEWHYRLGKLRGRGGEEDLRQAVSLAQTAESPPTWLAQAYFELAEIERSGGKRKDAIEHYRRFLDMKRESPYRDDAKRALAALGAPYTQDAL